MCVLPEARCNESSRLGMYVIFPADELIYMTYGAAIPRFKPRPTLDNLREPLVPIQFPNHSSNLHQNQIPSSTSKQSTRLPSTPTSPQDFAYTTQNSYDFNAYDDQRLPNLDTHNFKQHTPHPKKEKPSTDIFGYTSTDVDSPSPDDVEEEYYEQQYNLNETKSVTINERLKTVPLQQQTSTSSDKKLKPPEKVKKGLHLSLGRLKKSKEQPKTPEPARLRDITEIRIANPTFTRENLSARNYDAFFESGEPVYSLEYRTPVNPIALIESTEQFDTKSTKRPHSFGLFSKMSKSNASSTPVETMHARSRSSDPMVSQKGDRCHSLI